MKTAAHFALAAALMVSGCDLSMTRQPRYQTERGQRLWPDGPAATAAPPDAVPTDAALDPGLTQARPALTPALLARGRDRYAIYCTPCHGAFGDGDGRIVQHGFPRPPPYDAPRLRAAPAEHFVEVIGHGYGVMYGYGDRIPVSDRWAIAAYVRALQRAHGAQPASAGGRP